MKKQYINPACKVLTLVTKRSVLDEPVLIVSENTDAYIWDANKNTMQFDDAVDELIFGKKEN